MIHSCLALLGALFVLAGCATHRVFAEPKPAPDAVAGKRVHVTTAMANNDTVTSNKDFEAMLAGAVRRQLGDAGFVAVEDGQVRPGEDVDLDVIASIVSSLGNTATFDFQLRTKDEESSKRHVKESDFDGNDLLGDMPRAAAIHIVNAVIDDKAMVDFLERRAGGASRASVMAGTSSRPSIFMTGLKATGGVTANTARLATDLFTTKLVERDVLRVITPDDVESALSAEKQRDMVGCDKVSCMAEIGGALGTAYVGYGELGVIGSQYALTFVTVDSTNAQVVSRVSRTVPRDDDKLVAALASIAEDVAAEWHAALAK